MTKPRYPASPEWIERATLFLKEKWGERAAELGRDKPDDLKGACKFASLFAHVLFGGRLRGNPRHQFVVLRDGSRVDLTAGSEGSDAYYHDRLFWGNAEHRASLESCQARVAAWVAEFRSRFDQPAGIPFRR
jgi:hypothetical protein